MAKRRRRSYPKKHRDFLNQIRPHYDRLLEEQGGVCAIRGCGRKPEKRRLDIDHSWRNMKYRGLICPSCNIRLSNHEDSAWLRSAADYLDSSPPEWLEEELRK